ncbi:two-component sensor histidine kinase [Paenarthrobacter ureafaciens]|nr:two-component sensor histidine kinase [Paenarthrobacter ureafaciens]GLU62200.1 two-component sensor histidine kinase [Paenarthrobacter ureafaciens]GLU66474.1 two-component sensor histidine kinase [Paenarthrobacter ureafaciens]GLU70387.1 two-component sensor histidine kinase [Paenarthrobacter ureafaciens]GLU75008.1 two-component sensor histidine kinase [Paenarthrobacter ureafaciens]
MVSDIKQVPESSPGKAGQEETEQPPAGTGTQPDVPPAERQTSEGASSSSHRQERNVRWLMSRARIWTRRGLILVLRVSRLVSIGIRQIRPGLRFLWRSLLKRWRRSLEFRTVLTTLLLAVTSFAIVGAYLSNQIANNLFQERLAQAESESRYNVKQVQDTFDGAQVTDQSSVITLVYDTLTAVEGRGSVIQRRYVFEAVPEQTKPRNRWVESRASDQLTVRVIPPELRKAVQEGGKQQFWASMEFPVGNEDRPGIAVGNKVTFNGTMYELYLIYDLNTAQKTLDEIQNVLLAGGAALVLMIGAVAWYVTRNVVSPVSHAAVVSEKLAAGQLQERMVVKGEDEVARLGASFNHMAASLQEQITQLATLSQMQQRFVSDVSHELRTPLTTVRMAAEVLYDAREDFDPMNKRSAELLYNQVERFQSLLSDLLEISRFDAGAAVLDAEPQDIFQVLGQVIEGAAPVAEEYGSEVLLHAREKSIIVEMDSRRIDRILRNLVLNALEHGEGRPVHISVAANQDAVAIAVRDHGIGMTPTEAARVFDRFWRADPARARTTGGSGLGLSIAAEDTKLHNGWLQAWGRKGVGSNFRLTLPLRQGGTILKSPLQLEPAEFAVSGIEPGAVLERQVLLLSAAADDPTAGPASDELGAPLGDAGVVPAEHQNPGAVDGAGHGTRADDVEAGNHDVPGAEDRPEQGKGPTS